MGKRSGLLYFSIIVWCSVGLSVVAEAQDPETDSVSVPNTDTDSATDSATASDPAAESGDGDPDDAYPLRFARRPLVLHKGMVRGDVRVLIGGDPAPNSTVSALDIGGAVTPVENLEVGLSANRTGAIPYPAGQGLITVLMSPPASYGDIPLYARYQFHEGSSFLAGVDLVFLLPTNTDFGVQIGVPMRVLELFKIFTLDFNVDAQFRNGDRFTPGASNATFNFNFGGSASVSITDHGFIQIGGGVGVTNVNGGAGIKNAVELPFFLGGGYTIKTKHGCLWDVFAQFGWQPLMITNGPPVDTFPVGDTWFVAFGATIYTKPLF